MSHLVVDQLIEIAIVCKLQPKKASDMKKREEEKENLFIWIEKM